MICYKTQIKKKHEREIRGNQISEEKGKGVDKERTEAQQVRRISMKSWPKRKNGYSTSSAVVDELEVSPPTKCPR